MADFYFTEAGDIAIGADGDVAMTDTDWRDDVQAAYIRVMTDPGDFLLYPTFGAGLSQLYGMPQSPETGQIGIKLIESAMDRENRFKGKNYNVSAVPISWQSIRFDVDITSGSRDTIRLSVQQNLNVQ